MQVKIKEQPVKKKKKGLSAKRRRRVGDEDEAEEERQREEKQDENEDEDEEEEEEAREDPLALYTPYQLLEAMVNLLQPGETVSAALRRLGGLGGRKKKGQAKEEKDGTTIRDTEKLDRLTALADRLVVLGEYEIYQQTYEKLAYRLKGMQRRDAATKRDKNEDSEEEEELDMFADQFDEQHGRKKEQKTEDEDADNGIGVA